MIGYSFIHTANLNQGTNLFDTFLTDYLDASYFKAEPRTTLNWVQLIDAIAKELSTKDETWKDLFPPELPNELIADYIDNPRGMIESSVFTNDEIHELRQPHRILLFYFLKKISYYQPQNERLVRNFNNYIAKTIFGGSPKPSKSDSGFAIINTEEEINVDIHEGDILEAIIETEPFTRKYITHSQLVGATMKVIEAYNGFPSGIEKLGIERYMLPLTQDILPFRKNPRKIIDTSFQPAITIQSPLLCMREGMRFIHLWLTFEEDKELDLELIDFKLSTEGGWISIPNEKAKVQMIKIGPKVFQFNFDINTEFPPISPLPCLNAEEVEDELELVEPCQQEGGLWIHFKKIVGRVAIKEISLSVEAKGLEPMAIRNQEQVLEIKDNFQPFGLDAEPQTAFSFAHPELTHPAIASITTTPVWVGKPEDINEYYDAYKDITQEGFKLKIKTFYRDFEGVAYSEYTNKESAALFETDFIWFDPPEYPIDVTVPCGKWDTEKLDPLEHNLYFQFELTPQGFGVSEYPLLMTNYSVEFANAKSKWWVVKTPTEVNTPYVPLWSQFLIDYRTTELTWKADDPGEQELKVVAYEPLGYKPYLGEVISMGDDHRGFFAIGMESIKPFSTGSLYLNGLIGNTKADEGKVTWWYLSPSGWKEFTDHILIDGTNGLTQTGLFNWSIPSDMVSTNHMMPLGLFWLKATLEKVILTDIRSCTPKSCDERSGCQFSLVTLNGIFANAVSIVRQKEELVISKNAEYLPAGSELTIPKDDIEYTLVNPFRTSGEELEESELEFWARIFNRVRNRRRMVEIQDFEDLILHKFRDLALVKCNPRISGSNRVTIAVINKQFYGTYPYENAPKSSVQTLQKIEDFVKKWTSPFFQTVIQPKLVNPCYREVGFMICIIFKDDALVAENKERLYNDLRRYINPWLYEKHLVPKFGFWFDYGSVMAELQSKDYVEAVVDLKMGFVKGNELDFPDNYELGLDDILMLSSSNTIVAMDSMDEFERLGVGTMEIDLDFVVGI